MTDPADRLAAALSDRYRIERELGQGGMASVYLAQDMPYIYYYVMPYIEGETPPTASGFLVRRGSAAVAGS